MTMHNITNGDRSKWDYIYNMSAIEFLNYLSFIKDKQEYERIQAIKARHGFG